MRPSSLLKLPIPRPQVRGMFYSVKKGVRFWNVAGKLHAWFYKPLGGTLLCKDILHSDTHETERCWDKVLFFLHRQGNSTWSLHSSTWWQPSRQWEWWVLLVYLTQSRVKAHYTPGVFLSELINGAKPSPLISDWSVIFVLEYITTMDQQCSLITEA